MFKKTLLSLAFLAVLPLSVHAKTVLIGDSLMGTIGPSYVKKEGSDNKYYFKVSSGLINKKTYNWSEKVQTIPFDRYDEVIINIGTNDFLPISGASVGSKKWQEKYTLLQNELIKNIKEKNPNINIVWLSPPPLKDGFKNKEVSKVRDVINLNSYLLDYEYVDVRDVLGTEFLLHKNGKQIRAKDGIHYTTAAGDLIVKKIKEEI